MRNLFNPESFIWKPFGYLGDLVILSLLWVVFSIPIITLGPASAALYDATVHALRRRDETPIPRFWSTFRRELKEGVLSTLVWLGVLLALGLAFYAAATYIPACAEHWPLLVALALLLLFFLLGILCWTWASLSRFTMGLRALHAAALRLSLGHSLRSAAMAILWGATLYFGLRYAAPLFACPALAAWLSSFLIEPVFRQYEE